MTELSLYRYACMPVSITISQALYSSECSCPNLQHLSHKMEYFVVDRLGAFVCNMLRYIEFAEDKVLVFLILWEKLL